MNTNAQKEKQKVIALLTGIIVMLLIILFSSLSYIRATSPVRQAKTEAIQLAEQYAKIEQVDQFYWFTREQTYFSVLGKNDQQQEVIAIIPKSGEKVTVLAQEEGLTEDEAKEKIFNEYPSETLRKATLGMFEDKPVWEVMTKDDKGNNYYLLDFKDGKEVKVIRDI